MSKIWEIKLIKTLSLLIKKLPKRYLKAKTSNKFSSEISISVNLKSTLKKIFGTQPVSQLLNNQSISKKHTVIRVKNPTTKRTIKTEIIVEEITDETTTEVKTITETLVKELTIIVEENNHNNVNKKMIVISDDLTFTQIFYAQLESF